MKELKTIHGETMLVDDEDYEKAKEYRWTFFSQNGRYRLITIYKSPDKSWESNIAYKKLILGTDIKWILFINNNPLDLRRENIMIFDKKSERVHFINSTTGFNVNLSEVMQRGIAKKSKKNKYLGVNYIPNLSLPWLATISHNKMAKYLGNFLKEEHAAMVYDKKVIEIYGESAKRNFPRLTLKELTKELNKMKRTNKTGKASKYVGVCLDKSIYFNGRKWFSHIYYNGKKCTLGYFYTEEEAARAYDVNMIEIYGEDAKRNFPDLTLEELLEIDNIKADDRISFFDRLEKRRIPKPPKIEQTSQYVGVYASKGTKKWKSIISYQNKQSYIGNFDTEEDAAIAYDKRALELYGEDATLNFPRSNYNYTKGLKTFCGKTILYDEEDYEKAKQYRWIVNTWQGRSRVITTFWNREKNRTNWISYKELILGIKSKWTLYKNNNYLDLRRENILVLETRGECTSVRSKIYPQKETEFSFDKSKIAQRTITKGIKKTNYYGIGYNPNLQRPWGASITHNQKSYSLGNYTKEEYAAMAYDLKAIEIYGMESRRNFPNLTKEELTEMLAEIKVNDKLFSRDVRAQSLQGKRPPMIVKTSIYVGVSRNKQRTMGKIWVANIARHKKTYRLGSFYSEEDAARAYDKKALELYGEDAKLNFPRK